MFFTSRQKKITREEFDRVMNRLYGKLDEAERIEVQKLFRADLHETGQEYGISQTEFDSAIQWLNENTRLHVLEDNDIELIKEYFHEHLQD
jgi:hypothetical protein